MRNYQTDSAAQAESRNGADPFADARQTFAELKQRGVLVGGPWAMAKPTGESQEEKLPAKVMRQPPVTIDTLLTKAEFIRLVGHMMNGNPISHFLVTWTDVDGTPQYAKAKPYRRADAHPAGLTTRSPAARRPARVRWAFIRRTERTNRRGAL